MVTMSPRNRAKTGVLNLIVFHIIPIVEFDFTAISIVVCDGMLLHDLEKEVVDANLYPYKHTLLSACVSQNQLVIVRSDTFLINGSLT
jgi:hypothetical protein